MEMRQQGFISLYRSTIMVSAFDETDFSKAVARLREVSRRDSCIDRYTVPHTSVICTSKTGPASKEVGRAAVTSRSNVEEDHLNLRAYCVRLFSAPYLVPIFSDRKPCCSCCSEECKSHHLEMAVS